MITIKTELGMGGSNSYVAYDEQGYQIDFENYRRDDPESADIAWDRLNERLNND